MPKKQKGLIKNQRKFEKGVIAILAIGAIYLGYKLLFAHAASCYPCRQASLPNNVKPRDIGGGGSGVYVAGSDGYGYKWNGNGWSRFGNNLNAIRITADSSTAWAVSGYHNVYRWDGHNWVFYGSRYTRDIGVGSDGVVYAARDDGIYKWNGRGSGSNTWSRVASGYHPTGVAGTSGYIFYTDEGGGLYVFHSGHGTNIGAPFADVAFGGNLYGLTSPDSTGNGTIHNCPPSGCQPAALPGGGVRITTDSGHHIWSITKAGSIYKY